MFRVSCSVFEFRGSGFGSRILGSWIFVLEIWFGFWNSGFMRSSCFGFRVLGIVFCFESLGLWVWGLGFKGVGFRIRVGVLFQVSVLGLCVSC